MEKWRLTMAMCWAASATDIGWTVLKLVGCHEIFDANARRDDAKLSGNDVNRLAVIV